MNILVWHVHGSWTTSFVHGHHRYLLPVGPWGGGRMGRDWPPDAVEIHADELRNTDVDVVVVQQPDQIELAESLLGRRVPMVYVEHNTPKGNVPETRHPIADRDDIPLVHVTHFNDLMWDSGDAPTTVIEHGVVDPGERYTGELGRAAVVINEPVRRGRVTGTDLLGRFASVAPLDIFGMGLAGLDIPSVHPRGDLRPGKLHSELAERRVYVHTTRWTSLGLSLIEAMHLGMPVVAVAATEALRAVPPEAGVLSTNVDELVDGLRWLVDEPEAARRMGKQARQYALAHYGLPQFLERWDELLMEVSS
ncbi:glycosyltransferase [Kibdelosporangium persicum]|uniref:Glycosyltransferase involved in cell wall bisynthesis n=1 Tax=Kibdelosporangium persicum TaxID=2698649 RepID=A0ABX2F9D0_9PSEU|nr:glycosyltransferase [Kibdelosporangium persicum]NRN67565.1 Glycosyltransferase involved in cell wall bisynthesis [Kibdelosporangium persicum]